MEILEIEMMQKCPECGAGLDTGETCQDLFHQLLYWENENPKYGAEVHHLMVLSYHLQHPSLYSTEGLNEAKQLLVTFLERGATTSEVRKRNRPRFDSGKRQWKIKGTATSHGSYDRPIVWAMTAVDVVAGGPDSYYDNVKVWARSILELLNFGA